MKAALLKIGARISFKDLSEMSSTLSEVLATKKLFENSGFELDIYSKNPKNEPGILDLVTHHKEVNNKGYDLLVVVNGSIPFYGGVDGGDDIFNYKIISSFKGKIIYMLYDPYLGLKDISKSIAKKEAYSMHAQDVVIDRDDVVYITQCRDTSKINELGQKSVHYFPLEQFPIFMNDIYKRTNREDKHSDLAYCGSFRGGRRQKSMIEYFFGRENISAALTGNIKIEQFNQNWIAGKKPPKFFKPLKQALVSRNMAGALASVVIADPIYIEHYDIAQRAYENMIYGVANFIDIKVDPDKLFYKGNNFLRDYMYVKNGAELESKILDLKRTPEVLSTIIAQQDRILGEFNYIQYVENFKKLLEEVVL